MKQISEKEFKIAISNKQGDFRNKIFNFPIDLSGHKKINFYLDFENSIFSERVNFNSVTFGQGMNLSKTVFLSRVSFVDSMFLKSFTANKTEFYRHTNFNMARFLIDADFNRASFRDAVSFKKAKFYKSLFFNKTFFYKKTDFSYAYFSTNYITSFLSINKKYGREASNIEPTHFIFRYIHFSKKVAFTDVDITKTIFQDSNIENVTFKDCQFPRIHNRASLYAEQSKIADISIENNVDDLSDGRINTIILPNTKNISDLNTGDRLKITGENNKIDVFFIVTRFDASDAKQLANLLDEVNKDKISTNFNTLTCRNCSKSDKNKVIAFQIKRFNEIKHWEVLEDVYRQMKKSLEDAHDWQGAGDFYKGEMTAKIKILKLTKQKLLYRTTLFIYKAISCFGSSVKRILLTMGISLLVGMIILALFKHNLNFFDILEENIIFFIPIFGHSTEDLNKLHLQNWQNIIILMEIIWSYLLWLILAITIRRRFKR